jgi:GGDEF domain-containing protein
VNLDWELDPETGFFRESLLKDSIERELVRSRRFGREFALMLAGVDEMRLKFDYRDQQKWSSGLKATAEVLLNTRTHIDRVYRYGDRGFALLLPETGVKEVGGLLRRLARAARKMSPAEGEPGGPLPLHFGATFYPQCATTVEDIVRRAEVALRLAEKSPNRIQLDGAEAPDLPPPELMRREEDEEAELEILSGKWLGAEAPDEERAGLWLGSPAQVIGLAVQEQPSPVIASEQPAVKEPEPVLVAQVGLEPVSDGLPGATEVAEVLSRLDETLALIRSLKAEAIAARAA